MRAQALADTCLWPCKRSHGCEFSGRATNSQSPKTMTAAHASIAVRSKTLSQSTFMTTSRPVPNEVPLELYVVTCIAKNAGNAILAVSIWRLPMQPKSLAQVFFLIMLGTSAFAAGQPDISTPEGRKQLSDELRHLGIDFCNTGN